jgi:ribosomal protein S17E
MVLIMGKAMSNKIKAKAKIIIDEFKDELFVDFRKNKEFLKKMNLPLSKLTVNLMAGYITRTLKKEEKEKEALKITKDKTDKVATIKPKDKTISR